MKRLLPVAILLLTVAILGAPFLIGQQIESAITNYVKEQASNYPGYEITVENYDRRWWQSRTRISAGFDPELLAGDTADDKPSQQIMEVMAHRHLIEISINHGPVLLNDGVKFGYAHFDTVTDISDYPTLAEAPENSSIKKLFSLVGTIGFDGIGNWLGTMPTVRVDTGKEQIQFAGLSLEAMSYPDGRIVGQARAPQIQVSSRGGSLGITGLSSSWDLKQFAEFFWIGHSDFKIDNAGFKGSVAATNFSASGLAVSARVSEGPTNTMNIDVSYALDDLKASTLKLTQVKLDIGYERLGVAAATKYRHAFEQFRPDNTLSPQQTQLSNMQQQLTQEVLPELLASSPSFVIKNAGFRLDQQPFKASARVDFDGTELPDAMLVTDRNFWISRVKGTALLEASNTLARNMAEIAVGRQIQMALAQSGQAPSQEEIAQYASSQVDGMLTTLEQQGWLEKTVTGYRARFVMQNGEANINGQAIPLEQFGAVAP